MSIFPLHSLTEYSHFLADLINRSSIQQSTITVWSDSPFTGVSEGEAMFKNGIRLRVREELDFEAGLISSYGYEIYKNDERLYWYDDFPHPNDVSLASSFPHHKHVLPDIKHNRIPAPGLSFSEPNLPLIFDEIEAFADCQSEYL